MHQYLLSLSMFEVSVPVNVKQKGNCKMTLLSEHYLVSLIFHFSQKLYSEDTIKMSKTTCPKKNQKVFSFSSRVTFLKIQGFAQTSSILFWHHNKNQTMHQPHYDWQNIKYLISLIFFSLFVHNEDADILVFTFTWMSFVPLHSHLI